MSEEHIKGEARTEFGKGAARRIRRENKVPAVIYGHGADPIHLTLPGHETMMALRHGGVNALLEIDVDGKKHLALTKQVQTDPVRRVLEHVDFVSVKRGEKVTVEVPVHLVGEAAKETIVVTDATVIEVEAEATHIPEYIEVDITGAEAGTQFLAGSLTLPKGSTLLTDAEVLVVNVSEAQSQASLDAELEEAEAEAGIERDEAEVEVVGESAEDDSE
ncbi:50S ribosomal protein L25/general stress protein Ctc [Nocardioides sambongensis]|uniref:50S ribosomal protein L25/general stress protein Ctc n=1 Tax=Nocardioides sambongensis TaxID=2589074 RepID=UPI00112C2F6B|nr:50S ribosomal protein L25/general stress protein Ctc [Nocardioides sambongensis]